MLLLQAEKKSVTKLLKNNILRHTVALLFLYPKTELGCPKPNNKGSIWKALLLSKYREVRIATYKELIEMVIRQTNLKTYNSQIFQV